MARPQDWADRVRASLLLFLVLAQGSLGWMVRQHPGWLPFHLLLGLTLLLPVAMHVGLRAAFAEVTASRVPSLVAALLVFAQLVVGGFGYLVPSSIQAGRFTGSLDRGLVLLHWIVGIALVLASLALVASTWRPIGEPTPTRAPADST
ncbi:MAG TPA: hypothetical protein VNB06_18345 [Thermoanaerobaculia bacterium]|nr:hypothetical protein [Thermoanaerobaculia bacterium]